MKQPSWLMKTQTGSRTFTPYELSAENFPALTPFPPREREAFHERVLEEILEERAVSSRNRRNPRGVKRKMSNFPVRRRGSKPMPKIDLQLAIVIIK
jgi:hypothetical protein